MQRIFFAIGAILMVLFFSGYAQMEDKPEGESDFYWYLDEFRFYDEVSRFAYSYRLFHYREWYDDDPETVNWNQEAPPVVKRLEYLLIREDGTIGEASSIKIHWTDRSVVAGYVTDLSKWDPAIEDEFKESAGNNVVHIRDYEDNFWTHPRVIAMYGD